jgi:hypothetical protein
LRNISATVRPYLSIVWGRSVTTEPCEPLLAVGGHFFTLRETCVNSWQALKVSGRFGPLLP